MSLTLLLDLDDTLLKNDINAFVPVYLKAFAKEVAPVSDPEKFVMALWGGTREMMKNTRPDCTLQEVFFENFYPNLALDRQAFHPIQERFYGQVFPTLRSLTQPIPQAVDLVKEAAQRHYRLAIATNPMFPRTAVVQRLDWAGLPESQVEYDLIASFETFHFTKSDPAYYAELLARLGWPDGPVVMVGDDLEGDILNARKMGLAAFHIGPPQAAHVDGIPHGGQADVLPWLDQVGEGALAPRYTLPSAILPIMKSTPAVLDSQCRVLPVESWKKHPNSGEWGLTEILCHLRDVDAEVNLPRLDKILDETYPFIPGMDTDHWAEERKYSQQDGRQAFRQYLSGRMKLIDRLAALTEEDWQRRARHTIFGPTTLSEMMGIIASHDRLHIQQVEQVIKSLELPGLI